MEFEAGRELDALIAEQLFGYTLDYEFADTMDGPCVPALRDQYDEWGVLPHYSTDIGDAWLVVDEVTKRGLWFDIGTTVEGTLDSIRAAGLDLSKQPKIWGCYINRKACARADTAPLAICRAALAGAAGG